MGNTGMVLALAVVPLLAAAGSAIDFVHRNRISTEVQAVVDVASLAAATSFNASDNEKISIANKFLIQHTGDLPSLSTTVDIIGEEVRVHAEYAVPTTLLKLVGIDTLPVVQTAVAIAETKPICILSLNSSADKAIDIYGSSAAINAADCVVHANSKSSSSLRNASGVLSTADGFCAGGKFAGTNFSPTPLNDCETVEDPYASLPAPTSAGCDYSAVSIASGAATLSPGTYCGGIAISGAADVTFLPGVYIVKDGELRINTNGGSVSGSQVMFYLSGTGSVLNINAQSVIDLSAPKTGPYAGMVFVQDRANPAGAINQMNGGSSIRIVGTSYFPTQVFDVGGSGDFGATSPYMSFVADTFIFHGNGKLYVNLDASSAGFSVPIPKELVGSRLKL